MYFFVDIDGKVVRVVKNSPTAGKTGKLIIIIIIFLISLFFSLLFQLLLLKFQLACVQRS